MLQFIVVIGSLLIGTTVAVTGCYDRGTSCTQNTCTKFPEFARNSCAKTCGFCGSGLGGSTSLHSTFENSGLTSSVGVCYDKDSDCTHDVCQNYPYTAKERCAKFCGLCHDTSQSSSHYTSGSSSSMHQQRSSSRSRISESLTTIRKGTESIICIDKDTDCTIEICRNYPFTVKDRCAKTCDLCQQSSADGTTGSGRHTSMGIHEKAGGRVSSSSLRMGSEPLSGGLCFDKDLDCSRETCRDYPYTAKERCAKTCGFCEPGAGSSSTSFVSSAVASGAISPSRYASIRTNEAGDIGGTSSSRHSSVHGGFGVSDNKPAYTTLSRDKELECTDLDIDCTQQTCKDYPYTAKERCAKTCGFCRKEMTGRTNIGTAAGRHSSVSETRGTSSTGSHSTDTLRRGSEPSVTTEQCKDKDPNCSEQSCLDRPYTARTKCAKTCGFCGEGGSHHGSITDLRSPSIDSDDGTVITLDSDDADSGGRDGGSRPSTAISGHSIVSGGSSRPLPDRGGISGRTDLIRRPSSTSTRPHDLTTRPPVGMKTRYPGRTGPCSDENQYCETADCYKYPRFAQRYCEKTCGYC